MIHAAALDRAVQYRRVTLGRANARPVRCTVWECRKVAPVGTARRAWVDGQPCGFLCRPCQGAVTP